jgi:hypothetical protein
LNKVISGVIVLLLTAGSVGGIMYARRGTVPPASAREAVSKTPTSPVARENARAGTKHWRLGAFGHPGINGYAAATSVRAGDPLDVYVRTKAGHFDAEVFRMGWYGGAGGRSVGRIPSIAGNEQSKCPVSEKRHTVQCSWNKSFTLATKASWVTGVYLIKLTTEEKQGAYVPFVVRERKTHAPMIFQSSVTTWQAYNEFGGRSLYDGPCTSRRVPAKASPSPSPAASHEPSLEPEPSPEESPEPTEEPSPQSSTGSFLWQRTRSAQSSPEASPEAGPSASPAAEPKFETESTCGFPNRSRAVSFDRPYDWPGAGQFFRFEYPVLYWMESKGYDVAYATDVDLHQGLNDLANRRAFLSVGHDEYYSAAMRTELENALASGTSLAFFGANDMYRHIRFEPSSLGPDRIEVNYKFAGEDPLLRTDPGDTTGQWRDWPVRKPEQMLLGAQYACNPVQADWVPTGEPAWLFRDTGFAPGDSVPGIVGYEYDRLFIHQPHPDGVVLVARSPLRCAGRASEANSTFYVAPSGAGVFDAGTLWFTCAIGPTRCTNRSGALIKADPRVQQLVANLLGAMLAKRFE